MKTAAAMRGVEGNGETLGTLLFVPAGATRQSLLDRLARVGVPFSTASDANHALRLLTSQPTAVALVDLVGDRAALAAIRAIRGRCPGVSVAAVADPNNPQLAGEAMHAGAFDLLPWPFEDRDVLTVLANARDLAAADAAGDPRDPSRDGAGPLVAQSAAMRTLLERVDASARARGVLLCGEPGSGRTAVALAMHQRAGRTVRRPDLQVRDRRPDLQVGREAGERRPDLQVGRDGFILEDCARGGPEDLEQRLFGANTTALAGKNGRTAAFDRIGRDGAIYRSCGGTLCLVGLTEATARIQARLARLLRDREAELADQPGTLVDLDLHIITCADPDVDDAVADGRLRAELYDRIAQARIDVPPLRNRREDIPVIVARLITRACEQQDVAPKHISRSALTLLSALPWRGNVGELQSLIDVVVRSIDRPVIQLDDVLEHATFDGATVRIDAGVTLRDAKVRFERECIATVLARHHGRVGDAARALGIQRTNLYRKVRELQVVRPRARGRGEP